MALSPLHQAARKYAAAGWPVFQIQPEGKEPMPGSNGYKDATTDLSTIDMLWSIEPNANIGIEPERVGLCVVDIDPGATLQIGASVRWVQTPRDGSHIYFSGSLPPTQSKLGEHVDTRGRHSYVLLPPSHVKDDAKGIDGCYRWEGCGWAPEDFEYPAVPEWIVAACAPKTDAKRLADPDFEYDKPAAIRMANLYLNTKAPLDAENPNQDDYAVACRLLDFGLSLDMARDLCVAHGADSEWALLKLQNALNYHQNEPGCDVPTSSEEAFKHLVTAKGEIDQDYQSSRFAWHKPTEYRDKPPITFYDPDGMLPNVPGGSVGVIYGASGHHKTNILLTMALLAAREHDLRVLYVAGEGVYGFGHDRIWAHASAAGLSAEWIDEHIAIVENMPFLYDPEHLDEFEAAAPERPDIVIIDTLATGTPGLDENAKAMADVLAGNGACGRFRRKWGCLVITVAHAGKDAGRGIRGSGLQYANADFVINVAKDERQPCAIRVYCEKMRDGGREGATAFYRVEPRGVPVPRRITEGEYRDLTRTAPEDQQGSVERLVRYVLRQESADCWERGMHRAHLIDAIMVEQHGACPGTAGDVEFRDWMQKRLELTDQLRKAVSSAKKWTNELMAKKLPLGVTDKGQLEERWFVPSGL